MPFVGLGIYDFGLSESGGCDEIADRHFLLPGGHYDFASGTSVATAHVTGIVALLLAKNSKLTGAAVYQLLRDTTVHVDTGGDDSVDACGAVTALLGHGVCRNGTPVRSRFAMH